MGKMLPDRHPNKDFFVLDVRDSAPKDDMASMEHPVYSLSVKPDMRELEYDYRGSKITVVPSGRGLATIVDKDIVLYAISKLTHNKNQGHAVTPWVEFTAHEVMVGTNKNTSAKDYQRFEDALIRLRGTTIVTNIETGETKQTKGFGLIDEFEIERRDDDGELGPFGRMSKVRLKLSDWTFRAVQAGQVLTISQDYFRLRRPIERRLYELARKHAGAQKEWKIGLANLQTKVGSSAAEKKFRYVVREVIRDGNIPDYKLSLVDDVVTVTQAKPLHQVRADTLVKERTMETARRMAREKGYDFHGLLKEWEDFIASKGAPENADGALIGFIKSKKSLRQAQLL